MVTSVDGEQGCSVRCQVGGVGWRLDQTSPCPASFDDSDSRGSRWSQLRAVALEMVFESLPGPGVESSAEGAASAGKPVGLESLLTHVFSQAVLLLFQRLPSSSSSLLETILGFHRPAICYFGPCMEPIERKVDGLV